MNRIARVVVGLLVVGSLVGAVLAQRQNRPAWKPLFNGKNLEGWDPPTAGNWFVEDGAIVVHRVGQQREGGWLVTHRDYGDFLLRLKFKPGADTFNSGILIRDPGHARIGRPAFNGFEIQIAQDASDEENPNGAIYDVSRSYSRKIPAQEWTSFEVHCVGDHITSFMNGQKMAEAHTRRSFRGGIGFQMHGGSDPVDYRFKDIEIAELPEAPRPFQSLEEKLEAAPGEFEPLLPTGSPETDLTADGAGTAWSFRDAVLRGAGSEGHSWSITKPVYSDFVLDFAFRVSKEGVASVGFRLGDDPGKRGGYQFHIADADNENPTGSIFQLARAYTLDSCLQKIIRPGGWNQTRIYVSGDHLVAFVNLHKIAEVHTAGNAQGHIGFQAGPGTTIEFRNPRIKAVAAARPH